MIAKSSIVIERSIDEVFDYVSDVENMPRWVSGVSRVRLLSDKVKAGARFTAEYAEGMRKSAIGFKVVEFKRPTRFATTSERGPFSFPFKGTLELRAVDHGTEVTTNVETGPESLAARLAGLLFGPLLKRSTRRRLHDELEALRASITRNRD
ncbi:MAG: SRPBCC family protein [Acidimicrobiia bacterium]|nr:SRPBCC family protein [Acidimicrobiia bacterium]